MPIDLTSVGRETGPREVWWNSSHALLYAAAVGCPPEDLQFLTENSVGVRQMVLPTFACVAGGARAFAVEPGTVDEPSRQRPPIFDGGFGEVDLSSLLHGEQRVELAGPLPTEARVKLWTKVLSIWDKGSAAVVRTESRAHDAATGNLLYKTGSTWFIRGAGGFGGDRGPSGAQNTLPHRRADDEVTYQTVEVQPFLYRLTGDRNPLHTDPTFATGAGFSRPIMHGMCTYGFTARALVDRLCGSDVSRFVSMEGRFSKPALPGDTLTVKLWVDDNYAHFQTQTQRGDVVISHGRCQFTD
ncbi:MaoC/PaaZ C-terminal domain-containing protein [Nocardia sp. SC052]|uniref:MaoC/PaaZ C-terminal domain-containing protein n=1 Tax=Nocardia sichangensis TaxID=3385975 RepID=UPI0039A3181B